MGSSSRSSELWRYLSPQSIVLQRENLHCRQDTRQPSPPPDASMQFQSGKTIKGYITTVTAKGIWYYYKHIAYIHFRTSTGQTFRIGYHYHEKKVFVADWKSLMGIFGRSSWNVDQLGYIVDKKIQSAVIESVHYPTLSDPGASDLKPNDRGRLQLGNAEEDEKRVERTQSLYKRVRTGEQYDWSVDYQLPQFLKYTGEYVVEAGVPYVAEGSSGAKWVVGLETVRSMKGKDFHSTKEEFTEFWERFS